MLSTEQGTLESMKVFESINNFIYMPCQTKLSNDSGKTNDNGYLCSKMCFHKYISCQNVFTQALYLHVHKTEYQLQYILAA